MPATKVANWVMAAYGGKKNWLKWILIYLVVGGLIYFLIYYFFMRNTGSTYSPYSY